MSDKSDCDLRRIERRNAFVESGGGAAHHARPGVDEISAVIDNDRGGRAGPVRIRTWRAGSEQDHFGTRSNRLLREHAAAEKKASEDKRERFVHAAIVRRDVYAGTVWPLPPQADRIGVCAQARR